MSVLMRATIFFIFHFLVLRISIDLLDSDRRPVLLLLLAVSDQVIGYRLCVMRSKFYNGVCETLAVSICQDT